MHTSSHLFAPLTCRKPARVSTYISLCVFLLFIFVAACSNINSTPTHAGILLLGFPISLTGPFAVEGTLTFEGYTLWAQEVNKSGGIKVGNTLYTITLKYYDDGSDPAIAAQLAQKLITVDKVDFLLSPYGSPATLQVALVAERYHIPLLDSNGSAEAIFSRGFKYTFGVLSPTKDYASVMLQSVFSLPVPLLSVAILTADDAFSTEVAEAAREYATSINMNVVYYKQYPSGSTNLNGVLSAMMAANHGNAPDFILGSGHEGEAMTIMKEARDLGINPHLFGFTVGPDTPDFITILGNDANYVISSSQWTPQVPYIGNDVFKTSHHFEQLYVAAYGHEPAYQSADAAAAGVALQAAIENAGSIDPEKVRDALASLDVMTFYGEIKFDSQGLNVYKPMVTIQIQHGQIVTVFPSNVANGLLQYPSPAFGSR